MIKPIIESSYLLLQGLVLATIICWMGNLISTLSFCIHIVYYENRLQTLRWICLWIHSTDSLLKNLQHRDSLPLPEVVRNVLIGNFVGDLDDAIAMLVLHMCICRT